MLGRLVSDEVEGAEPTHITRAQGGRVSGISSGSAGTDESNRNWLNSLSQLSCGDSERDGEPVAAVPQRVRTWFEKRNACTLRGALAFVPWVLQQAYRDGGLELNRTVIHRGTGAVAFSEASGFTELTERLAGRGNGAELLSRCLTNFFTPLIDLINSYRGDVVKFSGDALMIYFPAVDDTQSPKYNRIVPPHGTYGLPDLGPMTTAVLRASACCIEIHKRLPDFETGVDNVRLCLIIGVGCGEVSILQVGGQTPPETSVPRCEYLIAGPPLEQISIAQKLAGKRQTCLSPEAWEFVKSCVVEGKRIESRPEYHLLDRMNESKYTFPTIKHAAVENDNRADTQFGSGELHIIRRFIPSTVFKQIEGGTLVYVNEMRIISIVFITCAGLDVMSDEGALKAQELMVSVQKACYQHEGTLNKFWIGSQGLQFLLVFGLPPLVHTDDPTRAVLACFDMVKIFKGLRLVGRFGVTTGRSYCGVCGSARRMEYTVLGDIVNVCNRLMASAKPHSILCDEETKNRSSTEVIFNALAPIKVKGREAWIPVFEPEKKDAVQQIGMTGKMTIRFPWYDHPFGGGAVLVTSSNMPSNMQLNVQQICSVKSWVGIARVQQMLGGSFSKDLHSGEQVIRPPSGQLMHKAPEKSPFAEGGVVVLAGGAGVGKTELAEHMVAFAACHLHMLPVFGTMGPRPGDSVRLATELLKSSIGVFRAVSRKGEIPDDDYAALQKLAPKELAGRLPKLEQALKCSSVKERGLDILESALQVSYSLIQSLVTHTAIVLVLQFDYGTSLHPNKIQDREIFWKSVARLSKLVQANMRDVKEGRQKPLVMLIVCRETDEGDEADPQNEEKRLECNPAIKIARERNTLLLLNGLAEENIPEYTGNYLGVPTQMVPPNLRAFVTNVTGGNPRHIRETIDQLLESCIQVHLGANKRPKHLECKDLDKVDISKWQHTAMVGETVCLLESLDPLTAAVLKMSTCFEKWFTLPDLAASSSSKWADATHFDFLRLFQAVKKLEQKDIIEEVQPGPEDLQGGAPEVCWKREERYGKASRFQVRNMLIKAVGGAMVLESQKKSVKRQALIDRALGRHLPARLEELARKRNAQHIPWYYEQAFRRAAVRSSLPPVAQ